MTEVIAAAEQALANVNEHSEVIPDIPDPGLPTEALVDRIYENANSFVNGENNVLTWNTEKQEVIIAMAKDIKVLMQRGFYPDHTDPHDISSMVCQQLKDRHFVDDNAFRWVRKLLAPYKWTRKITILYDTEEVRTKKLFTYVSKEEFAELSVEEQIKYRNKVLEVDQERKRQIRLAKDNMEQVFTTEGIDPETYSNTTNKFDPGYTDIDDDELGFSPPEELKQFTKFSDQLDVTVDKARRLWKILEGIREKSALYPPQNAQLDRKLANKMAWINNGFFDELIKFWSGYNDDKAVAKFDGWFDYLEEKALHGNNAAASKFAQKTGEFVRQTRKDGTTYVQALKRRVTNEHLKKKMPEQVKEIKNFWMFEAIFGAFRSWNKEQFYIIGGTEQERAEIEQAYLND